LISSLILLHNKKCFKSKVGSDESCIDEGKKSDNLSFGGVYVGNCEPTSDIYSLKSETRPQQSQYPENLPGNGDAKKYFSTGFRKYSFREYIADETRHKNNFGNSFKMNSFENRKPKFCQSKLTVIDLDDVINYNHDVICNAVAGPRSTEVTDFNKVDSIASDGHDDLNEGAASCYKYDDVTSSNKDGFNEGDISCYIYDDVIRFNNDDVTSSIKDAFNEGAASCHKYDDVVGYDKDDVSFNKDGFNEGASSCYKYDDVIGYNKDDVTSFIKDAFNEGAASCYKYDDVIDFNEEDSICSDNHDVNGFNEGAGPSYIYDDVIGSINDEGDISTSKSITKPSQRPRCKHGHASTTTDADIIEVLRDKETEQSKHFSTSFGATHSCTLSENSNVTKKNPVALEEAQTLKEFKAARRSLITNLILILAFVLTYLFLVVPSKTYQAYFRVILFSCQKGAMPIFTTVANFMVVKNVVGVYWKLCTQRFCEKNT